MTFRFTLLLTLLAATAVHLIAAAAPKQGWNPDTTFPPLSPSDAIKTIEVPKGYHLQCVASEPMVEEPVSFAFDPNGALYVCEWRTYMQDEFATDQMKPISRVVKLVDTDGDGIMDKRTVFIDNALLPRTVLPMGDRVIVSFTGDSSYWAYFDDNKDGVSDRKELIFKTGTDNSNIEHQRTGILWNLDNIIATNDVRFRLRDDGQLEPIPYPDGRFSQWGLARDDDGILYGTQAGGANPAQGFQLPAGYSVLGVREHGEDYGRPYSICKVWDDSSGGYNFQKQHILLNFSACCGQTILRSPLMPEFHGFQTTCEPVGRFIRLSRFERKEGLAVAHNVYPQSEFIRSTDAYFRPVWTENGPDGCLYIADMYRGIIQEKQWFPTEIDPNINDWRKSALPAWVERYHRVKKWGMTKVVRHGRIYRLVPDGKMPGPQPRMLDETPEQLTAHLAHPNGWWRDTAQMLLVNKRDLSITLSLIAIARDHSDINARIHALWTLYGLKSLPKDVLLANLKHSHPRVRRSAIRISESLLAKNDADITTALAALTTDPDPQVLAQVYLAHRSAKAPIPEAITAQAPTQPLLTAIIGKEKTVAAIAELGTSAKQGQQIYQTLCTACHGPDGMGVKQGDKLLAPAIAQSPWFKDNGDIPTLARILLHGQTGPIEGITYGEGLMLPLAQVYNDEQIASVLNYVGERWHRWQKPVPAKAIETVRKATADRKTPWTAEELRERVKTK
jgi:mono/diheme cytochrome c family protein